MYDSGPAAGPSFHGADARRIPMGCRARDRPWRILESRARTDWAEVDRQESSEARDTFHGPENPSNSWKDRRTKQTPQKKHIYLWQTDLEGGLNVRQKCADNQTNAAVVFR